MRYSQGLLVAPIILAACSPSDEVDAPETPVAATDIVYTCPEDKIVTVEDFPEETLPEAEDLIVWASLNDSRDGVQTTETGLQYKVISEGLMDGATPNAGANVSANYHGYRVDGTVFDSSFLRGAPFEFGTRQVIRGWTEAIEGMRVCEARTLYIPSELAYGDRGAGAVIRPGDTLVFNVQLLSVSPPE